MEIIRSLLRKLLSQIYKNDYWRWFFESLLGTITLSLYNRLLSRDISLSFRVSPSNLSNPFPVAGIVIDGMFAVRDPGDEDGGVIDGGNAFETGDELNGGYAVYPDSWTMYDINLALPEGAYRITDNSSALFYYRGAQTPPVIVNNESIPAGKYVYFQGGVLNVAMPVAATFTVAYYGYPDGFNLSYKYDNIPIQFLPGSYFNLLYAFSLLKVAYSVSESNEIDGGTATAAQPNELDGGDATTVVSTDDNIIDGGTASSGMSRILLRYPQNTDYTRTYNLGRCVFISSTAFFVEGGMEVWPSLNTGDVYDSLEAIYDGHVYSARIKSFTHNLIFLEDKLTYQDSSIESLETLNSLSVQYVRRFDDYALNVEPIGAVVSTDISKFFIDSIPARINIPVEISVE